MAEPRIPTMAHFLSLLVLLLWIAAPGESFSIFQVSKREKLPTGRFDKEHSSRFQLNKKELCLLKNCLSFKGIEFATCFLSCTEKALNNENNIDSSETMNDDAHYRRQIDPLQSCIEAKCSQVFSYSDCVYSECIVGLRLGYKNFLKKRANTIEHTDPRSRENGFKTREKSLQRMRKKSWNDPSDACISFHCGSKSPGSMLYSICVNTKCGNSYER